MAIRVKYLSLSLSLSLFDSTDRTCGGRAVTTPVLYLLDCVFNTLRTMVYREKIYRHRPAKMTTCRLLRVLFLIIFIAMFPMKPTSCHFCPLVPKCPYLDILDLASANILFSWSSCKKGKELKNWQVKGTMEELFTAYAIFLTSFITIYYNPPCNLSAVERAS